MEPLYPPINDDFQLQRDPSALSAVVVHPFYCCIAPIGIVGGDSIARHFVNKQCAGFGCGGGTDDEQRTRL